MRNAALAALLVTAFAPAALAQVQPPLGTAGATPTLGSSAFGAAALPGPTATPPIVVPYAAAATAPAAPPVSVVSPVSNGATRAPSVSPEALSPYVQAATVYGLAYEAALAAQPRSNPQPNAPRFDPSTYFTNGANVTSPPLNATPYLSNGAEATSQSNLDALAPAPVDRQGAERPSIYSIPGGRASMTFANPQSIFDVPGGRAALSSSTPAQSAAPAQPSRAAVVTAPETTPASPSQSGTSATPAPAAATTGPPAANAAPAAPASGASPTATTP